MRSRFCAAGRRGAGRVGAAAVHDQTLAVYRLLDALHERFPSLEIESCAGGGGRTRAQRQTFSGPIQSLVNDALSTPAIREFARADDVCDECV